MAQINWARLIVAALIAWVILFVTDGFIQGMIARPDWNAVYNSLGTARPKQYGLSMVYFALFELGRSFIALMFYATMRGHWGPGPKTAALAGIASWIAFSLTGPVEFIPLGFFSITLWVKVGMLQLVTSIIATMAGAALYKPASPKPAVA